MIRSVKDATAASGPKGKRSLATLKDDRQRARSGKLALEMPDDALSTACILHKEGYLHP